MQAVWCSLNKQILTGHEDGTLCLWDMDGKVTNTVKEHSALITDIQVGNTRDYFITASKDHTAIVFTMDLKVYRKSETERPVNSAAISPLKPQIMLGGGQDAMAVTTTSARQGKFETRYVREYFLVLEPMPEA